MRKIIFLAGVHGVGKTTLSRKIVSGTDIQSVVASELIKKSLQKEPDIGNKRVDDVKGNQNHFINAVNNYLNSSSKYILDGHFCLLNKQGLIEKIPLETFEELSPALIVLIYDDINSIHSRIVARAKNEVTVATIAAMQECELEHGFFVAKSLNIPFLSYHLKSEERNMINILRSYL